MFSKESKERILIVDDAPVVLRVMKKILSGKGFTILTAGSAMEAINVLEKAAVDLVITDLKMPKVSGLDLIRHVRENFKDTEIIMVTGFPSIEGAVEAVKTGAEEYLAKPFTADQLYSAVQRALNKLHIRRKESRGEIPMDLSQFGLIGNSPAMIQVFEAVKKAASHSESVYLFGENGTGREIAARTIHRCSNFSATPFIHINCAATSQDGFENDLSYHFGFLNSNMIDWKPESSSLPVSGTLYLDNIHGLNRKMQEILYRILQEYNELKSRREVKRDTKVISSSTRNMLDLVRKERFHEELFFQLNYSTITIPPLVERGDDIILLADHFAEESALTLDKPRIQIGKELLEFFLKYRWPGNVTELRNIIEYLTTAFNGGEITTVSFSSSLNLRIRIEDEINLRRTLDDVENEYIKKVLESVKGNKTKAAEILDVDRKTLRNKLQGVSTIARLSGDGA